MTAVRRFVVVLVLAAAAVALTLWLLNSRLTAITSEQVEGKVEFGAASRNLAWLPKAVERIFTCEAQGYHWTTVHFGGTLKVPTNDFMPRIAETLKASPDVSAGLLLREFGEWVEQQFKKGKKTVRFKVSCKLDYQIQAPATLLYNVRVRPSRSLVVLEEKFSLTPETGSELIIAEPEHNRFDRVLLKEGEDLVLEYGATVDTAIQLLAAEKLRKVPPGHLAPANLAYLLPSRYCQSDLLARFAWQKFGQISDAYDQVLEITKWIHENIEYALGSSTAMTSAYDTVTQCAGVCRDFAHLGIALCRALTIPARYFSGYAYHLQPPDFHACFEVYIGGYWILFDATRLASPNGLVRIGSGRDAADVSLCTVFGFARPKIQEVNCETPDGGFVPLSEEALQTTAVSLDAPFP